MYCGKCGANVPDGNVFCSNCGAPVSGSADQPSSFPGAQPVQGVQPVPVIMVNQPAPVRSNGIAIVGLVFSIIGLCAFWIPYFGLCFAGLGLLFSIIGVAKKNAVKGAAITGLVLSIVAVFLGFVLLLGIGTYLNKAKAASESQSEYASSLNKSISIINSEINAVM